MCVGGGVEGMVVKSLDRPAHPTQPPKIMPRFPEVNVVNLERVGFNLRNFDLVIIWKVGWWMVRLRDGLRALPACLPACEARAASLPWWWAHASA